MKSVMKSQYSFSNLPAPRIPRSSFNRSCGHKTTFFSGDLVPIFIDEVYPGDTFRMRSTIFVRLMPLVCPVMDNLFLDVFWFYVPKRILWNHWVNFMGEKVNPDDTTEYTVPQVEIDLENTAVPGPLHTLWDYFGLPTDYTNKASETMFVNAWWSRAYNMIYREWFRDQNLIDSPVVDTDDGPDNMADYLIRKRCKRPDYFTSCLPWTQKGEAIMLPLGDAAPVFGNGVAMSFVQSADSSTSVTKYGSKIGGGYNSDGWVQGKNSAYGAVPGTADLGLSDMTDDKVFGLVRKEQLQPEAYVNSGLYADLSTATASTINALRQAFQLQRMLEKDARYGTRYVEMILGHFGVICPDFRAQRPELLGVSSQRINLYPVPQTSATGATGTPQANLAAYGVGVNSGNGFTKSFTEHGVIMGIMNVRADLTYQKGIEKMFLRQTREEHYFPTLAYLGEEAVLNKEIWYSGTPGIDLGEDEAVFGYQERWADHRYKPSRITGLFRSEASGSLDVWHFSQDFAALPTLGQTFIEEAPPLRALVVTAGAPEMMADIYFDYICAREMPVFSVPGLIDHM